MLLTVMPSEYQHSSILRSSHDNTDLGDRYYCLSIFDKHHNPNIDFDQGMKILRLCTDELKRRLPIDFKGVRDVFLITLELILILLVRLL